MRKRISISNMRWNDGVALAKWSSKSRPVLVLVALVGLTLPAQAVFRGHDSDDIRRVMAVGRWNVPDVQAGISPEHDGKIMRNSEGWPLIATTSVLSHEGISERCMLTARHVAPGEPDDLEWHRVVMGTDVTTLEPKMSDQLIEVSKNIRINL